MNREITIEPDNQPLVPKDRLKRMDFLRGVLRYAHEHPEIDCGGAAYQQAHKELSGLTDQHRRQHQLARAMRRLEEVAGDCCAEPS